MYYLNIGCQDSDVGSGTTGRRRSIRGTRGAPDQGRQTHAAGVAADRRTYNRIVAARRWLVSGVLAVFTLLPGLQLQCEIACADDDVARPSTIADRRDECVTMAPSCAAPDDCVGHAAPQPMLPGAVRYPGSFMALFGTALPGVLHGPVRGVAEPLFHDARQRGSTVTGIPLRI